MMRSNFDNGNYETSYQNVGDSDMKDNKFKNIQNTYIPPNSTKTTPLYKNPVFIAAIFFIIIIIGLMIYLYKKGVFSKESEEEIKTISPTVSDKVTVDIYIVGTTGEEEINISDINDKYLLKQDKIVKKIEEKINLENYKISFDLDKTLPKKDGETIFHLHFLNDGKNSKGLDKNLRLQNIIKVDNIDKKISKIEKLDKLDTNATVINPTKGFFSSTDMSTYILQWGGKYIVSF